MPEWCHICHVMLSPGLEKCPNCGAPLGKPADRQLGEEFSRRDIIWYSAVMIGIVMIPILLIVAIGYVCATLIK
jgi:hypothetical protein